MRNLTDEEFMILEEVRAFLHGTSAALALARDGEGELDLDNGLERMGEIRQRFQEVLEAHGGFERVLELKEGNP